MMVRCLPRVSRAAHRTPKTPSSPWIEIHTHLRSISIRRSTDGNLMEISIGFSPILVHRFESPSELVGSCEPSSELVVLQRLRENQTISWMDRGLPPEKQSLLWKIMEKWDTVVSCNDGDRKQGTGKREGLDGKVAKVTGGSHQSLRTGKISKHNRPDHIARGNQILSLIGLWQPRPST